MLTLAHLFEDTSLLNFTFKAFNRTFYRLAISYRHLGQNDHPPSGLGQHRSTARRALSTRICEACQYSEIDQSIFLRFLSSGLGSKVDGGAMI